MQGVILTLIGGNEKSNSWRTNMNSKAHQKARKKTQGELLLILLRVRDCRSITLHCPSGSRWGLIEKDYLMDELPVQYPLMVTPRKHPLICRYSGQHVNTLRCMYPYDALQCSIYIMQR